MRQPQARLEPARTGRLRRGGGGVGRPSMALAGLPEDLQFQAVTGHKTREVVGVYVRPDRTFAEGAIRGLQRATREQKPKRS
jgi:hypothetical protein